MVVTCNNPIFLSTKTRIIYETRSLLAVIGFSYFFTGLTFVQWFVYTLDPVNETNEGQIDKSSSVPDEVSLDQSAKCHFETAQDATEKSLSQHLSIKLV